MSVWVLGSIHVLKEAFYDAMAQEGYKALKDMPNILGSL